MYFIGVLPSGIKENRGLSEWYTEIPNGKTTARTYFITKQFGTTLGVHLSKKFFLFNTLIQFSAVSVA